MTGDRRAIRGIVFDFDGTLVDSNAIKLQAYDVVFAGVPAARAAVSYVIRARPLADRSGIIRGAMARLAPWRHLDPRVREREARRLVYRYSRYCRDQIRRTREFPGVSRTLRLLAGCYRLGVASATPERQLRALVRERKWFDPGVPVYGTPRTKTENLQRLALRWRLSAPELVLVGDADADRDAASAFGCHFIRAAYGRGGGATRSRELSATRPADVAALVERMNRASIGRD